MRRSGKLAARLRPFFAGAFFLAAAIAAASPPEPPLRTITVAGEGEATGVPDVAITTLGVDASAPKAGSAVADASARMKAVVDALRRARVADRDIRTEEFSVFFESDPNPPRSENPPARPAGSYRVRNTVQVTIRDIVRASEVLDAALAAGANAVSGIRFTIEDPASLRTKARERAVADSRSRAEALARASGVAVGPVVSITEGSGGFTPRPMAARTMAMESAPPIEAGELAERVQIEAVYEIVPVGPAR